MRVDRVAIYASETDWELSGFLGDNDDVTSNVDAEAGVSISRGRDQARGRGTGRVAAYDETLLNASRDYSAEYSGSPLAGSLLPGRPKRFGATYGDSSVTMDDPDVLMDDPDTLVSGTDTLDLFTGTLDEIEQQPALGARRVAVRALGSMLKLRGRRISTSLMQSVTTGAAVVAAFQAGGLASSEYDVDSDMVTNGRLMAYWYADDEDLYDVVSRLVLDTEGYPAAFYERGNGVIAVEGRNYRTLTDRCQTVQGTFVDTTSDGPDSLFHIGVRYTPGIRDVINAATQEVVTRTAQALAAIWTYGQTVTLDSSGAAEVTAHPNDPFVNAVAPVVTTDFTLSVGAVTVALSRTSGGSTTISFSGGTAGASITSLQLRAQSYTATSTVRVPNALDTSDSQTAYGVRSATLNGWPGLTVVQAESLADGVCFAYGDPRPIIEVDVINASGDLLHQIMQREISDRIRVIEGHTGIDLELTIEQISHRIGVGRTHTVTFGCEKVGEADWARYDVAQFDVDRFGQ